MHVDQAGAHDEAVRDLPTHGGVAVPGQIATHAGDPIAVDQHIESAVESICGVNNSSTSQ
jgi:hypothetical protein